MMQPHSPEMKKYFDEIEATLSKEYKICTTARQKGYDPDIVVDIPLAKGISERVEGLVSASVPVVLGSGIAKRIEKLEIEYGNLDWRVALKIAEEVAKEKFCKFESKLKAMETGIRVGLAYITLGVISAPLEGFIELKLKKTKEGLDYFSVLYAGPIRAAGGTAAAVSLIISDFVRIKMGYAKYDPTEEEIKRDITEVRDYHERVSNLQYLPSEEEIDFLIRHCPVEINGDPTEEKEVSNYKDLPRIESNRIRGGLCLVLCEGLAQKAPKLYKQVAKWGDAVGLEWGFLKEFLEIQKRIKAKLKKKETSTLQLSPNYTYIKDLVAGRPILSHPMKIGGFRLRYGRSRHTGFAAAAIHPATMVVLDDYIAVGTQLKIERPGKAAAIVSCDTIDGPIVKLKSGDIIKLSSKQEAKQHIKEISKILFLGDILINYGDFSENGHKLVPAGYCREWWAKELEKAIVGLFGTIDNEKILSLFGEEISDIIISSIKDPLKAKINVHVSKIISKKLTIPIHPDYTYYWNNASPKEVISLAKWIRSASIQSEENKIIKLVIPFSKQKEILERVGVPHLFVNNEFIVIEKDNAATLYSMFIESDIYASQDVTDEKISTVEFLNSSLPFIIRDKCGTFIGARMGRPEKAKMRKLTGSPHLLFPVGEEGGRLRCIQSALDAGKITADLPIYYCAKCNKKTIFSVCEMCDEKTVKQYFCKKCGDISKPCVHDYTHYKRQEIDINYYFTKALAKTKTKIFADLIKGVKGTSNKDHVPENLVKGILRAKHGVFVNKDGTTRYDMIELPITHFKPKETQTPIEKLITLGYKKDIYGSSLISDEQVLEIKPQDMILPDCPDSPDEHCGDVLFNVANFIDDLLVNLYGLEPYYNLKSKEELVGHYVIGLAPHTSAGTVGRIIGFSKTQGMFTHPLFHAAMRRNCDGDEACVIMLMDALLNFSRSFLPDKRGSRTMDAPLVLTSILVPTEVDDEVHGLDIVSAYPLELYEAAILYKNPWDVKVFQIDHFLGTPRQYEKMMYTHDTSSINLGVMCSAYKTLPSMEEKLMGQMALAEKISAVDESDVARLVIEKHFLRDIKGNLRKYSTQQFRCVKCNAKFRRPPLSGKCTNCQGKIIFTISKGSIIKYLEPSLSIAKKYGVPAYLSQTLELTKRRIDSVLGKEKEVQEGLGRWFG
ncbi:MAG: DNA polymerase II large subunit [archaeon]